MCLVLGGKPATPGVGPGARLPAFAPPAPAGSQQFQQQQQQQQQQAPPPQQTMQQTRSMRVDERQVSSSPTPPSFSEGLACQKRVKVSSASLPAAIIPYLLPMAFCTTARRISGNCRPVK